MNEQEQQYNFEMDCAGEAEASLLAQAKADIEYAKKVKCIRCNDNGCPACDGSKGSKYNPEPY